MRLSDKVTIDKVEYEVLELTLRQIIDYFQNMSTRAEESSEEDKKSGVTTNSIDFFKSEIQTLLSIALEGDHKVEDFLDMAPSDMKKIYETFKKVNSVFFDIAAQMGITQAMEGFKSMILSEFSKLLVSSSSAAIKKSLTTASPTS